MYGAVSNLANPMYPGNDFIEIVSRRSNGYMNRLKYNPYENKKSILDIPLIRKYIAQRQWRKLCILFKLYPQLVQFNSYGYYTVSYKAICIAPPDYISRAGSIRKKHYTDRQNKLIRDIPGSDNYGLFYNYREGSNTQIWIHQDDDRTDELLVTIKKDNLNLIAENIIKNILLEYDYKIEILDELRI